MKILQVHKYLYRKAGAEAYVLDLIELLQQHGHEVVLWGPDNPLSFDRREGLWRDLKKFGHMIWSKETAEKFGRVLDEFQPDVLHIHNIYHHISPSILPVAARHKVPVVMTVHDWHLINPNYTLYDHGEICERNGLRAVFHRCIQDSYGASLAGVLAWKIHRWMRIYERSVSKFLVPTEFVKKKLVESGMEGGKIEILPLLVGEPGGNSSFGARSATLGGEKQAIPTPRSGPRPASDLLLIEPSQAGLRVSSGGDSHQVPYILYAGRLIQEKGMYVLLEVAQQLPEIPFKIAGTGPEVENVKYKITSKKLSNVELLGFLEKEELQQIIAHARLVLVPSLWYDLSPLAVLEAMAAGKVVVASKIGGIPALIENGKTGFLIRPIGPMGPIIDTIRKIYYDEALLKRIGLAAQKYIKKVHDPEAYYAALFSSYREVLKSYAP